MNNLKYLERAILVFLVGMLLLGVAISAAQKFRSPAKITIDRFDPAAYKAGEANLSGRQEMININSASAEDLRKIKGIGSTIAARIVEYRYQHGSFSSIDDIKNIKGVSVALFEKIKNKITIE